MSPRNRLRFLQTTCAQLRVRLNQLDAADGLREERKRLLAELSRETAELQAAVYERPQKVA